MRTWGLTMTAMLAACSQSTQDAPENIGSTSEASLGGEATGGTPFDVPSDSKARYALLNVVKSTGGLIIATTRRDGSSGPSFARREIDCAAQTYRYIGEGDTLDQANLPAPNPGEMSELVTGLISDVSVKFACGNQ